MASAFLFIEKKLISRDIILFAKSNSPESERAKCMLAHHASFLTADIYEVIDIEKRTDCSEFQDVLLKKSSTNRRTVPLLFIKGNYFADYDKLLLLYQEKTLLPEIEKVLEYHRLKSLPPVEEIIVTLEEIDQNEIVVNICDLKFSDQQKQVMDIPYHCLDEDPPLESWEMSDFDEVMDLTSSQYMDTETESLSTMRRFSRSTGTTKSYR